MEGGLTLSSEKERGGNVNMYVGFALVSPTAIKIFLALEKLVGYRSHVVTYEEIASVSWIKGRATIRRALLELQRHRLISCKPLRDKCGQMEGLLLCCLPIPRAVPREALDWERQLAALAERDAVQRQKILDGFPVLEQKDEPPTGGRLSVPEEVIRPWN